MRLGSQFLFQRLKGCGFGRWRRGSSTQSEQYRREDQDSTGQSEERNRSLLHGRDAKGNKP